MKQAVKNICRLCGKGVTLIEAHIIPQAFARDAQKNMSKRQFLLVEKFQKNKRSLVTGYFDPEILYGPCDHKVGLWEENLITLFRNGDKTRYCYTSIKLSILSILWKASVTTNSAFDGVKPGPFENEIYTRIKGQDPGLPEDFSIWIQRYKNKYNHCSEDILRAIIQPGARG